MILLAFFYSLSLTSRVPLRAGGRLGTFCAKASNGWYEFAVVALGLFNVF